ncbi:MAG: hypothetical protein BIFFINMI_00901 [Phycisphaerae bacterium]|nr:hypothetical protein [Phycisphaerae bacterium]
MATRFLAVLLVAAMTSGDALAIINPKFTPVQLGKESRTILAGSLEAGGADQWRLAGIEALKGELPEKVELRLAGFRNQQLEEARRLMAQSVKAPAVLFVPHAQEQDKAIAFLHVGGQWLRLARAGDTRWDVLEFESKLDATYAGGSDMLVRMMRYVLADPGAAVPAAVGMRWANCAPAGKTPGEAAGLAVIELPGAARPALFVACPKGDRLLRIKAGSEQLWEDVTAAVKLDSRSARFAWVDLDRNGWLDLVSWDGDTLSIRPCQEDGTFAPAGRGSTLKLDECLDLAPLAAADGSPGVLASTGAQPLLLTWSSDKGWQKSALPPEEGEAGEPAGEPSACIVADLDNDGLVEVLQPREGGGLLWRRKGEVFAPPVKSPVAGMGRRTCTALGDFDGDGFLDMFMGGAKLNRLWENDGRGGFREVGDYAGSLSYKAAAGVSFACALDLNHDGRTDLALCYPEGGLAYHFNRGFRCFGEEGDLPLDDVEGSPRLEPFGVRCCVAADFDGDGVEDLAVAFVGGEAYCFRSDLSPPPGMRLRLGPGRTGPVTVSAWQGEKLPVCLGTWVLTGHRPGRLISLRWPGNCTLQYSLPGKGRRNLTIKADSKQPEAVLE